MPHSMCAQLDKAGIMRLILSYLKVRKLVPTVHNIKQEVEDEEEERCDSPVISVDQILDSCYQKALEGFVIILSSEGDIIYLSDCVSKYLGLKQTDLMGHSVYDFTHQCDHAEIKEQLSSRHMTIGGTGGNMKSTKHRRHHHNFLIRFKCTLTPRGKKVNLKSAVYKVIQCSGHVQTVPAETILGYRFPPMPCLAMVGNPIHHPANIEIPLDGQTFLTRHSMDMKFTYCDDRIKELLGYESKELVGRSFYDFYHALDNAAIEKCHRDLFAKGQTRTGSYRFLAKEGGYAWLQTEATVIYSNKTNKAQCVVCVNYCLSSIENDGLILSTDQCTSDSDSGIELSTESVFAPKTDEDRPQEELLFWLSKGDVPQTDQEQETEEELLSVANMSLRETEEQQMFVPFDPFAPLIDDNKLTTIEELASDADKVTSKQDGYYSPPSSVPTKSILTGSTDPLMPDSRPPLENRKEKGQMALEDLELRAPYIPMEEDFELGAESNEMTTPFSSTLGDTWVPVDPFGNNDKRMERRSRSLCPSPFSTPCLTPQSVTSPLGSPVPSPRPVSSPQASPGANIQERGGARGGGGNLNAMQSRSLTNLTVPQVNYLAASPQPMNYGGMPSSPLMPDKAQPSPLPSPRNILAHPAPLETSFMIHTQISPTPPVASPACPNKRKVSDTAVSMPGLVSMLKRKSTGCVSSNDGPVGKTRRGCSGLKIQTSTPAIRNPAPKQLVWDPPNTGLMSNLLLMPQHQVSGIGEPGSYTQFLHRVLNVSNQNGLDGNGKSAPGLGASLIQQISAQELKTVKKPSKPPDGIQRRDSLPLIDCQDAEVNAPVMSFGGLLQGDALLRALEDQTMNRVPSQEDLQKYQQ
ncbi:hypoxia-inducible factor 1-alpha-like isoform X2 [Amphiura filiformis]|uniref:hypoxia-inducible factor 1-alpha-like isoform X2 n=1 Tax=Amphiura filiformis TaxID=82378 RepID=UPI003B225281